MKWEPFEDGFIVRRHSDPASPDDALYQIHTADRRVGDNTGKWLALYMDDAAPMDGYLAYAADKSGIWYCGGNALWNAIGVPAEAEFNSIEDAKAICEYHAIDLAGANSSRIHPKLMASAESRCKTPSNLGERFIDELNALLKKYDATLASEGGGSSNLEAVIPHENGKGIRVLGLMTNYPKPGFSLVNSCGHTEAQ